MSQKIDLTNLADTFYWQQHQPTDHGEMLQLMADFALHIAKKLLKDAAHNACQDLLLENVTPSIAFDVHDNIIETINPYE